MKKPNLILMRHGQSYTNSGRNIDNEYQNILTENGVMKTMRSARAFRKAFPEMHFDRCFCSPLPRAIQTNLNFLSAFDNRAIHIDYIPSFVERSLGFDSYLKIEDMLRIYGQEAVDSWETDPAAVPANGKGESLQAVYDRVIDAYETEVVPYLAKGETIMIVAHYYVLKVLQSYLEYGDCSKVQIFDPRNSQPYAYEVAYHDGEVITASAELVASA